jgi:DNA-binding MarR family transcriptional regulator
MSIPPPDWARLAPDQAAWERQFPGADLLASELHVNLGRLLDAIEQRTAVLLREAGLPSTSALIALDALRQATAPVPPSLLAERVFLTRGSVTSLLDTLERRGWVERTPNPDDRRSVLVSITPSGLAALEAAFPRLHAAERSWFADLTDDEKRTVLGWVARLAAGLRPADAGADPVG